jgi:steroid 5-alpha reductase family enzyme
MTDTLALFPWHTPYFEAFFICLGFIAATWLLSIITREYSWTDRVWSITPAIYATYMAGSESFSDVRLNVMSTLIVLWGARLTFNFGRKGGYCKGGEDYRWEVLKKRMPPWQFQFFNATFISPYQNLLLLLMVAPCHTAWTYSATPFGTLDAIAAGLFAFLLLGETVADAQMWRFQQAKKEASSRGEVVQEPFFDRGLYGFSRHPNYFCEISMWWVLYLFAVSASDAWLQWSLVGAALLHLLFEGSTRFTESISLGKYPSYASYQARVSRLIPWPPRS